MLFPRLIVKAILIIFVASCVSETGKDQPTSNVQIDSCSIASKYPGVKEIEANVSNNFTGEFDQYWIHDSSKLDQKYFFENGKLVKSYFYFLFNDNQSIQQEYTWKCGAIHGLQKGYYENGNIYTIVPYRYGRKNGTSQYFYNDGGLMEVLTYRNDSIISHKKFDEAGNLLLK